MVCADGGSVGFGACVEVALECLVEFPFVFVKVLCGEVLGLPGDASELLQR